MVKHFNIRLSENKTLLLLLLLFTQDYLKLLRCVIIITR